MNYIVFDLEWNQAPTVEEARPGLPFEIIEIGAVKVSAETLQTLDMFHRIIEPVVYPELFSHTRQVVALNQKDLEAGDSFHEAATDFLSWCRAGDEEYLFATWGSGDLKELQRNLEYFHIRNPFTGPIKYADVQQLYAISENETNQSLSLESVAQKMKISWQGRYHAALSDARYTAEILKTLDPELIETYPALDTYHYPDEKNEGLMLSYPDHLILYSPSFKTREELENSHTSILRCPVCKKKSKRLIPWHSGNGRAYYTVARCQTHGPMRGRRVFHDPEEDIHYTTITIKQITEEEAEHIVGKIRERGRRS